MKADRNKRSPDRQRPCGRWPASPEWPRWGKSLGSWEGLWSPLVGTQGPLCIVADIVPGAYMGRLLNSYQTYLQGSIMILKFRESHRSKTQASFAGSFLSHINLVVMVGFSRRSSVLTPVPEPRNLRRCLGLVSSVHMHHLGSC